MCTSVHNAYEGGNARYVTVSVRVHMQVGQSQCIQYIYNNIAVISASNLLNQIYKQNNQYTNRTTLVVYFWVMSCM